MGDSVVICVYGLSTGRILRKVTCPESVADSQAGEGEGVFYGDADEELDYVVDGSLVGRTKSPATISETTAQADSETVVTLESVAGILKIISQDGLREYEVEAGPVELTFDTPGEYHIRLEAFSYLPFEAVIHAY